MTRQFLLRFLMQQQLVNYRWMYGLSTIWCLLMDCYRMDLIREEVQNLFHALKTTKKKLYDDIRWMNLRSLFPMYHRNINNTTCTERVINVSMVHWKQGNCTPQELNFSSEKISEKSQLKNIIGAIDGCHQKHQPHAYFIGKKFYSIVLLGCCNSNLEFDYMSGRETLVVLTMQHFLEVVISSITAIKRIWNSTFPISELHYFVILVIWSNPKHFLIKLAAIAGKWLKGHLGCWIVG